jgi:tetratricopeptide (TPR) repeat protein
MPQLSDVLYNRLLEISKAADEKIGRGATHEGAQMYLEALDLLPKPIEQWEAATWLSGRAADALFLDRQYQAAFLELRRTIRLPGALGNPLIRLRLGQVLFEAGDVDSAKKELISAYMLAGKEIFEGEHPKYFSFIQELV